MQRSIDGFHQDEQGEWVAELCCGHRQHVRHKPPFVLRPWVITPEGRASKLGAELGCVRCDRCEMPEGFEAYKRTPEFDERSVPGGLLQNHTTRAGVWGIIHVLAGRLRYVSERGEQRQVVLDPATPGIIVPEVVHHVAPEGAVRFFVEFFRRRHVP